MRKADYLALARTIKEHIEVGEANQKSWPAYSVNAEYWKGWHTATRDVARRFADCASVDRAQFLKACGLDP